jgi:hypothetical protein
MSKQEETSSGSSRQRSERTRGSQSKQAGTSVKVKGPLTNSQFGVGKNIEQRMNVGAGVTAGEHAQLQRMLDALRAEIEAQAPPATKEAARKKVDELRKAITAKTPKVTTMARIRLWFVEHVPAMAGTVTGVIVSPIVKKLVEAGGDELVQQFLLLFPK